MNTLFVGKKLLVVGGTSGIGFETAKLISRVVVEWCWLAIVPRKRNGPVRRWQIW